MFKCSCCGECCRNLNKSNLYKDLDRGDGTCRYLEGNLCTIYEKRPLICRIDESYEAFFKKQFSLEKYYELNYKVCNLLKKRG